MWALACGENGTWQVTVGGCERIQTCGKPPAIMNGHLVRVSNESVGGIAHYKCDPSYYLTGSVDARCLSNLEWYLLPRCLSYCPIPKGSTGHLQSVQVEITECTFTGEFTRYATTENCDDPVKHVVKKDDVMPGDLMAFYGNELCVSLKTKRKISVTQYHSNLHDNTDTKCESFCMPWKNGYHRIIKEKTLRYFSPTSFDTRTTLLKFKTNY